MRRLILGLLVSALFVIGWSAVACSSTSSTVVADACCDTNTSVDALPPQEGGTGGDTVSPPPTDGSACNTVDAGAPLLSDLSVVANGTAPVTLVPDFCPKIFDYYVRCGAGTNDLQINMKGAGSADTELIAPTTSPSKHEQSMSLKVQDGDAVVAVATNGKDKTEYWVRCLPSDMPQWTWDPHPEAGVPPRGYYLVGNWFPPPAGVGGYAILLDSNGVPVWYWHAPPGNGLADLDSLEKNQLSYFPFTFPGVATFDVRNLSPLTTRILPPPGYDGGGASNHELQRRSNGNYVLFLNPLTFHVDLSGLEIIYPDGSMAPYHADAIIQDCAIVEFDPSGKQVFYWLASDHFDPKQVSTFPDFSGQASPDGGPVVDPLHCNGIDIDPVNGNFLVSARNMDSVFYVDRSNGKVLWKLGGAQSSKDKTTFVTADDPFYRQHDARFQPGWSPTCMGGAGEISVFDDQTSRPNQARGAVYSVVVGDGGTSGCDGGAPSGTPGTASLVWSAPGSANTDLAGSFRILADGSRVVGWGLGGVGLVFSEFDSHSNDLLDFRFNDGEGSYRALKVPLSELDLELLRHTAGKP